MENTAIQSILWEKFEQIKLKNSSYSMRSFANKLSISSGALSNIMQGKRKISKKMALKIFSTLDLTDQEWTKILNQFSDPLNPKMQQVKTDKLILELEQTRILSDWVHLAIMALTDIKHFNLEVSIIAKKLDISESKASECFERLKKFNLLEHRNGRWTKANGDISTSDGFESLVLKKIHTQNLELAKKRINTPIETRDFTATTFAIDSTKMKQAKELVRKFHAEMENLLEKDNQDQVYKLCVQLFPLTTRD